MNELLSVYDFLNVWPQANQEMVDVFCRELGAVADSALFHLQEL